MSRARPSHLARQVLRKELRQARRAASPRYTPSMEDFADMAKARASWRVYADAMKAGRDIMRRAGVPDPPPVPEFDAIFRRFSPAVRQELYTALNECPDATPADVIQIWQPLIKKAFGRPEQ